MTHNEYIIVDAGFVLLRFWVSTVAEARALRDRDYPGMELFVAIDDA
jgi:hypothetical protein